MGGETVICACGNCFFGKRRDLNVDWKILFTTNDCWKVLFFKLFCMLEIFLCVCILNDRKP